MDKEYIGADEVGVGDYFGGIVTCAAFVNKKILSEIDKLNIKIQDSKKLSNSQIISTAKKITKIVPYEVEDIYPYEYNKLYNKFKNAHVIKLYAHNQCIYRLKQKIKYQNLIIILDQFADRKNLDKYYDVIQPKIRIHIDVLETKAEEKYQVVAIASIIARYYFLKQIANLSKKYKVVLPLGYNKDYLKITIAQLKNKLQNNYQMEKQNLLKIHFKY